GGVWDQENNGDHFGAREYAKTQGRWLTPDPAGLVAVDLTNPQTWNRYAYVLNNPLSYRDPTGLVTINPSWYMGFGGGGGCSMDGVDTPCNVVQSTVNGGGAVPCPNNNCGIGTSSPYQCVGTVCGYMSNQYVGTHENEYNGVLYSNSEWQTFLTNRVDAQQQALADAIVAANPSLSWQAVYGSLQYLNTAGGNANFAYQGNLIDLSFIPGYNTGGCEVTCRFGGISSIHMPGSDGAGDPILHLDSGNPLWGFGLGAFVHGFVDVLLGNINPSVPMGPW
ncbi:MAG: RHS repeat-associated core domain-containing protein, partial [Terriglobales bacterium]